MGAVTTLELYPAVAENVDAGAAAWVNASNALASDQARASCSLSAGAPLSNPLRVSAFDASALPGAAAIVGLEVVVEARVSGLAAAVLERVELVVAGEVLGTPDETETVLTPTDASISRGGASSLWGLGAIGRDVLADPSFGVHVVMRRTAGSPSCQVDAVWLVPSFTMITPRGRGRARGRGR